jgi:hypothetical protein
VATASTEAEAWAKQCVLMDQDRRGYDWPILLGDQEP